VVQRKAWCRGLSPSPCFELLARIPDLRGITPAERTHLIEHLTREEYLFESGGLLSMGTKAERIFGRKNFAELYAVFSSPVMYGVETETGRALTAVRDVHQWCRDCQHHYTRRRYPPRHYPQTRSNAATVSYSLLMVRRL